MNRKIQLFHILLGTTLFFITAMMSSLNVFAVVDSNLSDNVFAINVTVVETNDLNLAYGSFLKITGAMSN